MTNAPCSASSTEIFPKGAVDLKHLQRSVSCGNTSRRCKIVHVGIGDGVGAAWPLCDLLPLPLPVCSGMFPLGLVTHKL